MLLLVIVLCALLHRLVHALLPMVQWLYTIQMPHTGRKTAPAEWHLFVDSIYSGGFGHKEGNTHAVASRLLVLRIQAAGPD